MLHVLSIHVLCIRVLPILYVQNVQASFQKATRIGQSSEFQFQQKSDSVKLRTLKGVVGWAVTTDLQHQKVCLCVATFIRLSGDVCL